MDKMQFIGNAQSSFLQSQLNPSDVKDCEMLYPNSGRCSEPSERPRVLENGACKVLQLSSEMGSLRL